MNQLPAHVINAVNALDTAASAMHDTLVEFASNSEFQLDSRDQFLVTAAMSRLREARSLFLLAAGVTEELPDEFRMPDVKTALEDLHAAVESSIISQHPLGGAITPDQVDANLATRMAAFNTLDHAEISAISALTHFKTITEFLVNNNRGNTNEIETV